jgi:hypothetical protein
MKGSVHELCSAIILFLPSRRFLAPRMPFYNAFVFFAGNQLFMLDEQKKGLIYLTCFQS